MGEYKSIPSLAACVYAHKYVDAQLIRAAAQETGNVQRESEVATTIESGFLPIDVYSCLVVDRAEVEEDFVSTPIRRNPEGSAIPAVEHIFALHAW